VNLKPRFWLLLVAILVLGYQFRLNVETIREHRTLLFIPFRLKSFSPYVETVQHWVRDDDDVHRGDEVLALNGRPLIGASEYAQELHDSMRLGGSSRPLWVTLRSGDGTIRIRQVHYPNCDCGGLSGREVLWWIVLPRIFCVFTGLLVVAVRSRSALSWIFLRLMLSFSQMATLPGGLGDWSQAADPMEWRDWTRVPALAYQAFFGASWPAWLLLFGAYICHLRVSIRVAWAVAVPMLAFAVLKAFEAIARSENFSNGSLLHQVLETHSKEFLVGASLCALIFAAQFGRRVMVTAAIISGSFIVLLYWPAALANSPEKAYWTSNVELPLTTLEQFKMRDFLAAAFTLAMVVVGLVSNWSKQGFALPLSMLALLIPFLYSHAAGSLRLWWGVWVVSLSLGLFALGSAGLVWFMIRSPQR